MANELTITKERVLEAASKCSQEKETLKTLFPEVFEEDKYFDLTKLTGKFDIFTDAQAQSAGFFTSNFLKVRERLDDPLRGRVFFLSGRGVNWELKTTNDGGDGFILIPTRKQ